MMRKICLAAVLAALFAVPAAAGDQGLDAVSSLKVDLEKVEELRTVSPVEGVTAAGQPSEAALEVFADSGYAAVIDLRGPDENRGIDEAGLVEELGMDYVPLPIKGREAISFENARKLDALIAGYDAPVLVHCGSSNRVGALMALRASLAGADDDAALEAGKEAGMTSLEGVVRERLSAK